MKLVAKKLSIRPLHSTALSSRSGAPPHHPQYLHHNAMRTHQEVTNIPLQGRKKHQVSSKGLWRPSTSIWEHPPQWFAVGLFIG